MYRGFSFVACILLRYIITLSKYTCNRNWNSCYFILVFHNMFRPLRAIFRWNTTSITFLKCYRWYVPFLNVSIFCSLFRIKSQHFRTTSLEPIQSLIHCMVRYLFSGDKNARPWKSLFTFIYFQSQEICTPQYVPLAWRFNIIINPRFLRCVMHLNESFCKVHTWCWLFL
jgi:hypothetical protein